MTSSSSARASGPSDLKGSPGGPSSRPRNLSIADVMPPLASSWRSVMADLRPRPQGDQPLSQRYLPSGVRALGRLLASPEQIGCLLDGSDLAESTEQPHLARIDDVAGVAAQ